MREDEILDAVKKRKRTRPDLTDKFSVHAEPGEMSMMIQNAMTLANLPEIDMNNPEQVRNRVGEYFQICSDRDMKPSASGMALALGIDRRRLWELANGIERGRPHEVVDTIKKGYSLLNNLIEEYMQNGKINPVSGIFLMKNNFGYADKTEVVLTPNNPLGEVTDEDKRRIEEKYRASIAPPDEGEEST